MTLSTIFAKPIDRPIEGVIKADDAAGLRQEVEEYVITNEVAKRLEDFLAAYTRYQGANGVWISGFFGSGKSHLLKMLALLLENRTVDGISVPDSFLEKCGDNEILRGDIRKAVAIPSQSVLFNIDQKADVISKNQVDALLAVFVKVFDEMCGYYGKQGHIAKFERDLDSRGQYAAFQERYAQIADIPWTQGREQALLEGANIAAAYAQATGADPSTATGILDKYRSEYKVSIEDFAEMVDAYIRQQGPNFRLNFFVDEAGQYIADNVKLMTNLQTLAESLHTKCRGRAWLLVTAQEDMSDVVGEMSRQQTNDFTKIMARFANRMKLTSADVNEVIERRLLLKNERGIDLLSDLYAGHQNNFRTLFDFGDGSITYRNFRDREHFIHAYPFIPYQFTLFQTAIRSLSQHNAFEGKHSSVGERSMLGVFQQVVKAIAKRPVGQLATFDLMFEGIRTTLKTQIQGAVLTAEDHLDDPFAVKLLKALFLVKYVKEFKATPRNLTVLMLDRLEADLPALRKRVEAALALLEQQTYIQRTGDNYEYLTNEEKDVEQEIKHTEVDDDAVAGELGSIVFDEVLKDRKIRYENGQDYTFARKLDDATLGRQAELAIHVISPFHPQTDNEPVLRAQAMGRDELLVILPPSDRLLRDLLLYKQTEKYIRQNINTAQRESVKHILAEKQVGNRQRREELVKLTQDLLSKATLVVAGEDLDPSGSDAQTRIVKGFHDLVTRTYPHLRMLRGVTYTEQAIGQFLRPAATLFSGDEVGLSEAEGEMLAFIQGNRTSGLRTTLQSLVNKFERKPYGWYLAAIQCTLAKLFGRSKVEARRDGALLENGDLEQALRNTHGFANVVLDPQIDFTSSQVRDLKEFYADFFDAPPQASEPKPLAQATAAALENVLKELTRLRGQGRDYPFLSALDAPLARLREVTGKPYTFYLTDLRPHADDLLDAKEGVLDPLRQFMAGPQRTIYDEARAFLLREQTNLSDIGGDAVRTLAEALADSGCYKGQRMTQVKSNLDALRREAAALVQGERQAAQASLESLRARLSATDEYAGLAPEQQAQLARPFDDLRAELGRDTLAAVMRDRVRRFADGEYRQLLTMLATWSRPAPEVVYPTGDGDKSPKPCKETAVEYVARSSLSVPFAKPWLESVDDVQDYLAALETVLVDAIEQGKRIQI